MDDSNPAAQSKHNFKPKEGRFRQDIRKKPFTVRPVRHWNKLPKYVVDTLSQQAFEARLDQVLGCPI